MVSYGINGSVAAVGDSIKVEDHDDNIHLIEGIIVGRRSLGRKLAFADIALTVSPSTENDLNSDPSIGIGEHCANESWNSSDEASIKVIFLHRTFLGPSSFNLIVPQNNNDPSSSLALEEPFPTKISSLPYGAKVMVQLGICQKASSKDKLSGKVRDVWQVSRWRMKEHPRELAEQLASLEKTTNGAASSSSMLSTQEQLQSQTGGRQQQQVIVGSGAISSYTYLKARGEAFQLANRHKMRVSEVKGTTDAVVTRGIRSHTAANTKIKAVKPESPMGTTGAPTTSNRNATNNPKSIFDDFDHGGKHFKGERARIFASWVLETFFGIPMVVGTTSTDGGIAGDDSAIILCQPCATNTETANKPTMRNTRVLDIAGGKGQLSLELILQQMNFLASSLDSQCMDEKKEDGGDVGKSSLISQCTIIDPMVRKCDAKRRHSKLKRARSKVIWQNQKQQTSHTSSNLDADDGCTSRGANQRKSSGGDIDSSVIDHLAACFDVPSFPQLYSQCMESTPITQDPPNIPVSRVEQHRPPVSLLLLGLHPDQCTEDILDMALEYNLPVAIVPCCVFPDLFPSRQMMPMKGSSENITIDTNANERSSENESAVPVRSYEDFLQYLMDKDNGLQMTSLPFEGKNKVIYKKVV